MSDKPEVTINQAWCKSCKICVEVCPKDVLEMEEFYPRVAYPDKCIGCKLCETLCPDFAITVKTAQDKQSQTKTKAE